MLGCGLRRAEVCELRVKQVSFKNRAAKIIGKGNKERTIYFPDAVDEVLKIWFEFRQLNKMILMPDLFLDVSTIDSIFI